MEWIHEIRCIVQKQKGGEVILTLDNDGVDVDTGGASVTIDSEDLTDVIKLLQSFQTLLKSKQ